MYVILGASGKTGGFAADALIDMGKPVRVVVRSAEKGAVWKARGADVAVADVDEASALARVLRGADGAYIQRMSSSSSFPGPQIIIDSASYPTSSASIASISSRLTVCPIRG